MEGAAEGAESVEVSVTVDVSGVGEVEEGLDAGASIGLPEILVEDVHSGVDEGHESAGSGKDLGGEETGRGELSWRGGDGGWGQGRLNAGCQGVRCLARERLVGLRRSQHRGRGDELDSANAGQIREAIGLQGAGADGADLRLGAEAGGLEPGAILSGADEQAQARRATFGLSALDPLLHSGPAEETLSRRLPSRGRPTRSARRRGRGRFPLRAVHDTQPSVQNLLDQISLRAQNGRRDEGQEDREQPHPPNPCGKTVVSQAPPSPSSARTRLRPRSGPSRNPSLFSSGSLIRREGGRRQAK